jgi:hypothetical protein
VYYFDPNAGTVKFSPSGEDDVIIDDDDRDGDDITPEPEPSPEDDENEEGGKKDEPPLEVSGFAMLALLASVGGVLFLALRRGA